MSSYQQVEELLAFCKRRGILVPPTCKTILNHFYQVDDFIDAEELWFKIKSEGQVISFASVYNGLRWLCDRGYALQQTDEAKRCKVYKLTLPAVQLS